MNSKTTNQIKSELLNKKNYLSTLQNEAKKASNDDETLLTDMADRSEVEEAWSNKERMSQHWKTELNSIENALRRIEAGTFGVCEECDDEIPVKRLRVRPDATLCLYCQEAAEKERASVRAVGPNNSTLH